MSTPLAADGTEITVGTTLPPWLVTPTTDRKSVV